MSNTTTGTGTGAKGRGLPMGDSSFSSVLSAALVFDARWTKESFENFPLAVYWLRQLLALLLGLLCGALPVTGAAGFVTFGVVNALGVHLYATKYANVDTEDFTPASILAEGFQPSLGVFVLCWILTYTYMTSAEAVM